MNIRPLISIRGIASLALAWAGISVAGVASAQTSVPAPSNTSAPRAPAPSETAANMSVDELRKAANDAMRSKDYAQAIARYSALLARAPNDATVLRRRASAYSELQRYDEAIADNRRAIELAPNDSNHWNGLCWHQILANQSLKAREACERAVALDAGKLAATVNLGHTYLLNDDRSRAWQSYHKTIPLIDTESDLLEGPLDDFRIFKARGWAVELAEEGATWFAKEGRAWLARKAPLDAMLAQAKDAEDKKDFAIAVQLRADRLPTLVALYGDEQHPRVRDAREALMTTRDKYADALTKAGDYAAALPHYQAMLQHLEATGRGDTPRAAAAAVDVALTFYYLARYIEAEPLFRRALAITEKEKGSDHIDVVERLNGLANLLYATKRYAEAEPLYRRALYFAERAHGVGHPNIGIYLTRLANVIDITGRHAEAEPHYRHALLVAAKRGNPESVEVRRSLTNLADSLRKAGRHLDAEPLYRRALEMSVRVDGPDNPIVGYLMNALAVVLRHGERHAEAESLYRRAISEGERVLGPDHADVAMRLHNLAQLLEIVKRPSEAEPLYRRALSISEKALPVDHPDLVNRIFNLARLLNVAERYEEAEQLARRALSIDEQFRGSEHPDVALRLDFLGNLLSTRGRFTEAESLRRRALAITEHSRDPSPSNLSVRLNNLAIELSAQGNYLEALEFSGRAVRIAEQMSKNKDDRLGSALTDHGSLLSTLGRYDEAELMLRHALSVRETSFGPEHEAVSNSLLAFAHVLDKQGRHSEAQALLRRSLAVAEKSFGPDNTRVGNRLANLATSLRDSDQFEEAEALLLRALRIEESINGASTSTYARRLGNLASLYLTLGRYLEAEALSRRSLAILENTLGTSHRYVAHQLNTLSTVLEYTGRTEAAEPHIRRTLAIIETVFPLDHPEVGIAISMLANWLEGRGRFVEAEPLFLRALTIFEKAFGHTHENVGEGLANLARVLQKTGNVAEAEVMYRRALEIAERQRGSGHTSVARRLGGLANLLNTTGRYAEAESLYLRAYRVSLNAGVPRLSWTVQGGLMHFYGTERRAVDAVAGDPASSAQTAAGVPSVNGALAVFYGKQAVNTLQSVRAGMKSAEKDTQKSFLATVEKTYQKLAKLLIDQGRLPEAQQVLAMLKEEELHEFIRRDEEHDPRATRASFTGFEAPWNDKLQAAGSRLTALGSQATALRELKRKAEKGGAALTTEQSQRLAELDTQLEVAAGEFQGVLDAIKHAFEAVTDKRRYAELSGKGIDRDLSAVIGALGAEVALLQYVSLEESTYILLTTGATRLSREVKVKRSELNSEVNALLGVLKDPKADPRPTAQALYARLIAPVAEDLKAAQARTLMLSPDGVLRYVPLAALHDGERYLIERYALSLHTDAARETLKDKPRAQWQLAGMGVTQPHAGFSPLPAVQQELTGLVRSEGAQAAKGDAKGNARGILPGIVKLDEAFNAESLRGALRERFAVVHIASHFKFDPAGESASFLLLGDGKRLSLEALRKEGYRFADVDLLTLSACETAVGGVRDANGREIEGFGAMAQKQGAKGVMATLWPVADQSTGELMQRFYREREARQLSKAEALRQAQLALLRGEGVSKPSEAQVREEGKRLRPPGAYIPNLSAPYAHPYYWAPFVLMGNWL